MSQANPLPETIGYALAHVCKLHRQRAGLLLEEVGLHVGQEMMLCVLWERDGMTQTELADALRIQPATVTNALQRMEREGFVERRSDAQDHRRTRVYVTEKGRLIEAAIRAQWHQLEDASFGDLSVEERVLLRRLLWQVYENLCK